MQDYKAAGIQVDEYDTKLKICESKSVWPEGTMISPGFKKLSDRFRHLSLVEIANLECKIRAAGGSVTTHSGVFVATRRQHAFKGQRYAGHWDNYVSWSCCGSAIKDCALVSYYIPHPLSSDIINGVYHCGNFPNVNKIQFSGLEPRSQLLDPNPMGKCDSPVVFRLDDIPTSPTETKV